MAARVDAASVALQAVGWGRVFATRVVSSLERQRSNAGLRPASHLRAKG